MVRGIIVLLCFLSIKVKAQQENYIRPGLLAVSLTISPSVMLNQDNHNAYLTGFFEGYLDERISFRGEGNFVVSGLNDSPYYEKGFRTTTGVLLHTNKNNLDAHIGMMPGIYIARLTSSVLPKDERVSIAPVISLNAGGTFYMWKYAHVFLNIKYTSTSYRKLNQNINGRADELMFSAGLGFNINTIKK